MSSVSSTRKPNAAAAPSTTLFKASSRFINGSKPGAMKRQRQSDGGAALMSAESNLDQSKCGKKRFVGVRQRPSGRWVAEIKDTTQKIRLWLGTFDSAEEGAKAYDSAARALRGANTRTNFVPAMASEGASAPASKAARLIRLRQMAAAAKATSCSEKADSQGAELKLDSPEVIDSPAPHVVRPDLQQSTSSSSTLDPPSPAAAAAAAPSDKPPPRLIDRRPNVSASPRLDGHDDGDGALPFAAIHDHGTVDNGSPKPHVPSPKLEPQQSITSETLSSAIPRSSSPPLNFPSPRSHFECMQPENHQPSESLQHKERPAMETSSFSQFKVESLEATSVQEASRPSFSCATNRDNVSMYPPERDELVMTDETFILREEENFAEMDQVPWSEYTLESAMLHELPGLDESSGVYTSAFDFSMDRDSCTSVDHHDEFLALRMLHYERGTSSHHDQCVLLTQPLDSISSSCAPPHHHVWKSSMDHVDGCWDGQSSGSTKEMQIKPRGDGGEDPVCVDGDQDPVSSVDVGDHDVWSSMDLPPLCMVA